MVDLTRKCLDEYALRNLSNGKFQSVVFVRSASEAVFTTNLLRSIRQDRLDIDGIAAHLHPDKHRESTRFMEPLLAEILQTLKRLAPIEQVHDELEHAKRKLQAKSIEQVNDELEHAKRKLQAAGFIFSKAVTDEPLSFPTAATKDATDKWLEAHQVQFKGQFVAFKKHVSEVCNVLQNSATSKAEYVSAAAKYALNEKLAGRMSINNLSAFIAACQYEAA